MGDLSTTAEARIRLRFGRLIGQTEANINKYAGQREWQKAEGGKQKAESRKQRPTDASVLN
nr:hypothetical protein [Acidobacteriota bacterium]